MNNAKKRLLLLRLLRWPRSAGERLSSLFRRIPEKVRFASYCAALVALMTLLVSHYSLTSLREYRPGDVVKADVVVPADLQVVDERATAERQRQARDRVPLVFDYDQGRATAAAEQLGQRLGALGARYRQQLAEQFGAETLTPAERLSPGYEQLLSSLAAESADPQSPFHLNLSNEAVAALAADGFSEATGRAIARAVGAVFGRLIYQDEDLRLISASGFQLAPEGAGRAADSALRLSAARLQLQPELQRELPRMSRAGRAALATALRPLVVPNLTVNREATEAARQRAEEEARPVIVSLPRNVLLLRAGDMVTAEKVPLLEAVRRHQLNERQPPRLLALCGVIAFLVYALYQAATRSQSGRLAPRTNFWVAGTAVLMQLLLVRVGLFIAAVLSTRPETMRFGDAFTLQFGIPFAACALVLSLLVGSRIALVAGLIVALLVGLLSSGGIAMSIFAASGSIAAVYGVQRYRTRNAVMRASLVVGAVNVAGGVAVMLIANHELGWRTAASAALIGLLGALLTAAAASFATPIYESAFDILTDIKLLELSNADLPLLRQMAIQTPGTNHHSFVVGTLAEAAAKAVGANALLARIGCLYHDIGKLGAPKMYIENQQGGPNPHDHLDPHDSVRIITGHVRRGIKMAHEVGLPPPIADFIPQHHGTRVLAFFYHKAKAQAEARGEAVNIEDFRYPGPKPQSIEAVILMFADAAEAAVRSLDEPTPENIRAILKKIVDTIVADGQLDECNITFREITTIRESLVQTLIGIYHHRISYPGFNPPSEAGAHPPEARDAQAEPSPVPQQARVRSTP